MALLINDSHIHYYHMDASRSLMMGHGYFLTPGSLVVKVWI